jgi:hypothetical protein
MGLTGWVDGRKRGMKVVTSVPTEMTTTAARANRTGFSYRLSKRIRRLLAQAAWNFTAAADDSVPGFGRDVMYRL